jgi:hypothetical protein
VRQAWLIAPSQGFKKNGMNPAIFFACGRNVPRALIDARFVARALSPCLLSMVCFRWSSPAIGQPAAHWLREHVEVPTGLLDFSWHPQAVHRAWLAEALNLCLLHKLVDAVPDGRRYVQEQAQLWAQGGV